MSIPLHGPKGKGTLYVVAKKSAGQWKFETLQVEVEGQSQRIDLLTTEGRPSSYLPNDSPKEGSGRT